MARAALAITIILSVWLVWWRAEDAAFTRNLFKPLAVTARVEPAGAESRFTLSIADTGWTQRRRAGTLKQLADLIEDHGKLVHLFLVAEGGQAAFAHLHPTTSDTITFATTLPRLPAGTYSVFADVVHASGFTQTLTSTVTLAARASSATPALVGDTDDSWAVGRTPDSSRAVLEDGTALTWLRTGSPLIAGQEAGLRFLIAKPTGDTASIEPYLGMAGHAVVVRDDGRVFIHLHPLGTISLAAQARLADSASQSAMNHAMGSPRISRDTLYFPYAFPSAGKYTVWVQFKRGGHVQTGSFSADVGPS